MFRPLPAVSALLLTVAVGAAAPACASGRYYQRTSSQRDYRDVERLAYDNGYREGFRHGERDAADRRGYRIDRDREYRNADSGYRYGDRSAYRRFYRNGYEAGYAEGYNRVGRSVGNNRGRVFPTVRGPADGTSMPRRPLRPGIGMAWKPDAATPATVSGTIRAARNGTGKATTTTTAATAHAISTSRSTGRRFSRDMSRGTGTTGGRRERIAVTAGRQSRWGRSDTDLGDGLQIVPFPVARTVVNDRLDGTGRRCREKPCKNSRTASCTVRIRTDGLPNGLLRSTTCGNSRTIRWRSG